MSYAPVLRGRSLSKSDARGQPRFLARFFAALGGSPKPALPGRVINFALNRRALRLTYGGPSMNPTPQTLGQRDELEPRRQAEAAARCAGGRQPAAGLDARGGAEGGVRRRSWWSPDPTVGRCATICFRPTWCCWRSAGRQVSALATGAEAVQRNPYAEVIFYCDDPDAPEVSAAAVLGITRIVPAQSMAGLAGPRSGGAARARRLPAPGGGGDHRGRARAADAGDRGARRRAPAAADGRDAVPRELHPVPADPERQPAGGRAPRRRPLPDDVRDDPEARHLDEVVRTLRVPRPR